MSPGKSFTRVLIDTLAKILQELEQATETGLPFEEAMHIS